MSLLLFDKVKRKYYINLMVETQGKDPLVANMFSKITADGAYSRRFGIKSLQITGHHADRVLMNAGWYNPLGDELGFGDLSSFNVARIARELEPGEGFVVLQEDDRSAVEREGADRKALVAQTASFLIMKDAIMFENAARDASDSYLKSLTIDGFEREMEDMHDLVERRVALEGEDQRQKWTEIWVPEDGLYEYAVSDITTDRATARALADDITTLADLYYL